MLSDVRAPAGGAAGGGSSGKTEAGGENDTSAVSHAIAEVDRTGGSDLGMVRSAFSALFARLVSLQAPVRIMGSAKGAAAIEQALAEAGPRTPFAIVAAVRFLQRRTLLLKADLANTGLMNAKMLLRGGRGVSYEREALLKRALGAAGQRQQQQVPGADHVSVADLRRGFPVAAARLREAAAVTAREGSTALDAVVSEMAMGLVGKDDAVLPARECPETLLLDLDAPAKRIK